MEAKELRIWNLVERTNKQTKEKLTLELTASCILDISCNGVLSSFNYEPIPLTEEWLLKFGFETKGINRPKWTKWKVDLIEDEKGIFSFDESRIYIDIEFVHQLQNLYFALTGEELELIKEATEI